MHKSISCDGHSLYPAFPYTAFAKINDQDVFVLYAHLHTLPAVSAPIPQSEMVGPLNMCLVNAV